MALTIGIASSIFATTISGFLIWAVSYFRERKGHLAGWWWQVSYPERRETILENARRTRLDIHLQTEPPILIDPVPKSKNSEVEPSGQFDISPGSIDLMFIRHSKERFTAKSWRVFNSHYGRKWRLEGRVNSDSMIDGLYTPERGEGGHGAFHLWMISRARYVGEFSQSKFQVSRDGVNAEILGAPLEWIRVGSDIEPKVLDWLKLPDYSMEEAEGYWPGRVRQQMRRAIGHHRVTRLLPPE